MDLAVDYVQEAVIHLAKAVVKELAPLSVMVLVLVLAREHVLARAEATAVNHVRIPTIILSKYYPQLYSGVFIDMWRHLFINIFINR